MVNIVAMFSLAQKAVRHMKKGSAIINVASIQAYQPTPGILDYACTKVCTTGGCTTVHERNIELLVEDSRVTGSHALGVSVSLSLSLVLQGAIVTMTKGLGQALATEGIRVNAIAPGPVYVNLTYCC